MPWDISLIFGLHTCHVYTLYSEQFFWNPMVRTGPTSQKPLKVDNFYKNCPIWLRFGMKVRFTPLYHPEKFQWGRSIILPSSPTSLPAENLKKWITSIKIVQFGWDFVCFGWDLVGFTPLHVYHPEKFQWGRSIILPSSPTKLKSDL